MSSNNAYGKKGATFGKIVLGIILFILLWIYIYHHGDNSAPIPVN